EGVKNRIPGLGARGFASDLADRLVEKGVRALGGPKVWGAMKINAALCSAKDGGAYYVAQRLKEFCKANPKAELHAVGHSAGSIFHSHFLPAARSLDVPAFASLQLLAPAIRMDEFRERIMPLVGARKAVRTARMFTMRDSQELEDTCIGIYRKSLLYLIYHALEASNETPILGLEASVMEEPEVRQFFTPSSGGPASAVWSLTDRAVSTPVSTQATTHGGFDDESATMSSVAAHILGSNKPVVPYPGSRSVNADWPEAREWLRGFERTGGFALNPAIATIDVGMPVDVQGESGNGAGAASTVIAAPAVILSGSAKRKALCIGIDAYRGHELHGCVNDATNWAKAFTGLGFDTAFIRDKDATIEGILQSVRKLVSDARSGDVLAIQFAGHGYQLNDVDQDESEGDGMDEALVPYDFEAGAFILDDDIRREFSLIRPGVSLTCFLDCCHSGTATRVFASSSPANDEIRSIRMTGTPRYLKTDRDERLALEEAHASFRSDLARGRTLSRASAFGRESMQWINFSACKSEEEALEHGGAGDFTTHALFTMNGKRGAVTNDAFQQLVIGRFGERRAQTPVLDCKESDKAELFLAGVGVSV
ncbi:MAG: caspase family protein, partial [Gemmatimonas sp.]